MAYHEHYGSCGECGIELSDPANVDVSELAKLLTENAALTAKLAVATEKYNELLMQVSMVHEGESRHETALRYIRKAEAPNNQPALAKIQEAPDQGTISDRELYT